MTTNGMTANSRIWNIGCQNASLGHIRLAFSLGAVSFLGPLVHPQLLV